MCIDLTCYLVKLTYSNRYFVCLYFLKFSIQKIMSSVNIDSITSFPIWMPISFFILPQCPGSISVTRQPYLVPDRRGKASILLLPSMILAVGFHRCQFYIDALYLAEEVLFCVVKN